MTERAEWRRDEEQMRDGEKSRDREKSRCGMEKGGRMKNRGRIQNGQRPENTDCEKQQVIALRHRGRILAVWIGAAVLAACFCMADARPVFADVIWTPDDPFYEDNYEDCEYAGRRYYANGPKGYVSVVEEPGSDLVLDYIPNGQVFYVSMSYNEGISQTWGLVQYHMDEEGNPVSDYGWGEENGDVTGWIDMSDLLVIYDAYSFEEEHGAEIKDVSGDSAFQITMPKEGVIYLWGYPGSENIYGKLDVLEGELWIDRTYEDPDGNLWGYSSYYYGYDNFWINLSNPGNKNPKVSRQEEPNLVPALTQDQLEKVAQGRSGVSLTAVVAALVIFTAAISAALIYLMAVKK